MPKSKQKSKCLICGQEMSASVLKRHFCECHSCVLQDWKREIALFIEEVDTRECVCCSGKLFKKTNKQINWFVLLRHKLLVKELNKRFCCRSCYIKSTTVWNKGLTKETNASLEKISKDRMGTNNPIHVVLRDPVRKQAWMENMVSAGVKKSELMTGKSYEEKYGPEKAVLVKEKIRQATLGNARHKGFKHSQKTKNIIRMKAVKQLAAQKNFISRPHQLLFDTLNQIYAERVVIEHPEKFFLLDIAFIEEKICVEVDGDFYHSNEKMGFSCKTDIQKRNRTNDKRKNTFLKNRGWTVIRIWENEINNEMEQVLSKIRKVINERKVCL